MLLYRYGSYTVCFIPFCNYILVASCLGAKHQTMIMANSAPAALVLSRSLSYFRPSTPFQDIGAIVFPYPALTPPVILSMNIPEYVRASVSPSWIPKCTTSPCCEAVSLGSASGSYFAIRQPFIESYSGLLTFSTPK